MNIITPDTNDRKFMDGLRSAVLKHMERTIIKAGRYSGVSVFTYIWRCVRV